MVAPYAKLKDDLTTLNQRWERIIQVPETPRTLMGVIEYSLDKQRKAEVYLNRLLRYFLDPDAPHGMGDEFLRTFLENLPQKCDFNEDIHNLSNVRVDDQIPIGKTTERDESSESFGFADLLIEAPNEWFVLVEIKFGAGENNLRGEGPSQTEVYYQSPVIDSQPKTDYESGEYYVYLYPVAEQPAREPEFINWTWENLTSDVLEPFISKNEPRYPHRTVVHLRELVDDIKEITGMTEHASNRREKIELYLDHYETIHDVSQAFETRWESFAEEWPDLLEQTLRADGVDTESWHFRAHSKDWGQIFRHGWWRRCSNLTPITDRASGDDARIQLLHRLEGNREEILGNHTLYFYFRNAGSNDQNFIDTFNTNFDRYKNDIAATLPEASELTGQRRNLIEAAYDIPVDKYDDFFDAYIATLAEAFVDHAAENQELIDVIDRVYEESIDIYK